MISKTRRLLKLGISLCYWAACYSWKRVGRGRGKNGPGQCVVLCYHLVRRNERALFARQMDELLRWAKPTSVDHAQKLEPGVLYAAVTFDDAHVGVREYALPELVKRNIPCTIFVPTGYLGRLPQWEGSRDTPDADEMVMTAEQLRSLPADSVAIGSHSVTHPNLQAAARDAIQWELRQSREELERIVGREVKFLAFPYGAYSSAVTECARDAGYQRVFTVSPCLTLLEEGEYVVGRVSTNPTDWLCEFRLKINGGYGWIPLLAKLRNTVIGWAYDPARKDGALCEDCAVD